MFAVVAESSRHCPPAIRGIYDVIPVEHVPGLPAAKSHDLPFTDTGSTEVSGRGPPKIVKEPARNTSRRASPFPNLSEITYWFPVPVKHAKPGPIAPLQK